MDARLSAANAILNRGVRFRLPAPFYKRMFRKDYVTIRHLKLGTIVEMSRIVIESDLENAITFSDNQFLQKAVEPCVRCLAVAILNDKEKIEKKTDKLTKQLMWKVAPESIVDIFTKISTMNRLSDFMNITRYLLSQMMMMMNKKNLGQEEDGG
ncbi:MAG TPA: hypothetical protein VKX35_05205 [Fermentimonas sp.]|nr:hypothetical protein [Fermentimonas sp.]